MGDGAVKNFAVMVKKDSQRSRYAGHEIWGQAKADPAASRFGKWACRRGSAGMRFGRRISSCVVCSGLIKNAPVTRPPTAAVWPMITAISLLNSRRQGLPAGGYRQ
jgi:hypothetical protein